VKNLPEWLKVVRAVHGARAAAGAETRADAAVAVAAEIMKHPEFVTERMAVLGGHEVGTWLKSNASSGDLFQAMLFDGVPVFMYTSVDHAMRTIDMTAADLDKAKSMVETRTRNTRESADRQWSDFTAFYEPVRPRLTDGRIVADALAEIAMEREAGELAAGEVTA
jgi:hypothetical protein